jgi:hypothetical protein
MRPLADTARTVTLARSPAPSAAMVREAAQLQRNHEGDRVTTAEAGPRAPVGVLARAEADENKDGAS